MTGFAVFDLETTGIFNSDRVVEVGVVLLDDELRVEYEWSTLVNPHRDVSAGQIHGIVASDVHDAPDFEHVAEHVAALLDRRVVVAHNVTFDLRMLARELSRARFDAPGELLVVDTLRLARVTLGAPAALPVICEYLSIDAGAHEALGDARAAAQVLTRLVEQSDGCVLQGAAVRTFTPADVGAVEFFDEANIRQLASWSQRIAWPAARWLNPAPSHTRSSAVVARENRDGYLARLVAGFPASSALAGADLDPYLLKLEEALLDRLLTTAEAEVLAEVARSVGLSAGQVQAAHLALLSGLATAALADGVLTEAERADLGRVASLLGLDEGDVEAALTSAAKSDAQPVAPRGAFALAPGDRVVFTGEASVPRSVLEVTALGAGLAVTSSVSKKTAVVVMADPLSESTKARKARDLGVPIIAEAVFQQLCAQLRSSAGLPPAPPMPSASPELESESSGDGSDGMDVEEVLESPFADGWRVRREGAGISIEIDIASLIDQRLLDPDLPDEVKRDILEADRANRRVCGDLRWADFTDERHRQAHEAWDEQVGRTGNAAIFAAVDELVAARCPEAGKVLALLPYRVEGGWRAEFDARMDALRHFRAGVPTTSEQVRSVAQNLSDVMETQAGRVRMIEAERELGAWLRLFAPCDLCRGRDLHCSHLDIAGQVADRMAWDAKPGDFLPLARHLAKSVEARPEAKGGLRERLDLLVELSTASPMAHARLMEAVAASAEQELPGFAIAAYEANVQAGLAERWEFDRLSMLLERARKYEEAVQVAELGLQHPDCGASRGERLRKRIERCRRKAEAAAADPTEKPAASPAVGPILGSVGVAAMPPAGVEETLTCERCGSEFNRVRTRGRKPRECPGCRV